MHSPRLTIILPTFNEAANVPIMVERIAAALPDTPHEVIFVDDDSPDPRPNRATRRAIAQAARRRK